MASFHFFLSFIACCTLKFPTESNGTVRPSSSFRANWLVLAEMVQPWLALPPVVARLASVLLYLDLLLSGAC